MGFNYYFLHGISFLSRIGHSWSLIRPTATRRHRHHDRTQRHTTTNPPIHLAHAITNTKTLIPITLDIKTPNYQRWSHFFTITVGRFSLSPILFLANPAPPRYLSMIGSEAISASNLGSTVQSLTTFQACSFLKRLRLITYGPLLPPSSPIIKTTVLYNVKSNSNLSRKALCPFTIIVKPSKA